MSQKMRHVKAWQRQWQPVHEHGMHMAKWSGPGRRQARRKRVQFRRGYGTANGQVWQRRSNPRRWHSDVRPLRIDAHAYRRRTRRRRP